MFSFCFNNVIVVGCMMIYFLVILFGLDGGLIFIEEYGKVCIVSVDIFVNCLGWKLKLLKNWLM